MLNGIAVMPVMIMTMHLTTCQAIIARFAPPRPLQIVGWLVIGKMAATVVAMVGSWLD